MINKKLFFSLFTIPAAVVCHESSEWQKRRKEEKEIELNRRTERLNQDVIDITPVDGKFAFGELSPQEIEEKFGFRRVKVKGILDLEMEYRIKGYYRGEEGYFICNPLYTHVDEKKQPCGIIVNRGWISFDWQQIKEHTMVSTDGYFEGIIHTGDKMTKYDSDTPNNPLDGIWTKAIPAHLSLVSHLRNREDSDKAMLMLVEFDDEKQTIMPSAPTVDELTNWKNTPARHGAYHLFWKYTTYANLFANTMFWLYF
jgi:hypothetical protein